MTMTMKQERGSASFTPPVSTTLTTPSLYPWDTGHGVAEMQELLCAHGYCVRVDGDFGWVTEVAVKAYQRKHGLRVDGIVGPKTWAALLSTIKPGSRALCEGRSGADVYVLQRLLRSLGYDVTDNGIFGEETRSAVETFQQERNFAPTGTVCILTWRALRMAIAPPTSPVPKSNKKENRIWRFPVIKRHATV